MITGDFNIHVNDPDDRHARRLSALLETFGLVQSVSQPTHRRGNTLDLLITRAEGRPTESTVDPLDVISDHALVVCHFASQSFAASNVERTIRPWKKVDRSALRDALMSTALCSEVETSRGKSAVELFDLYDDTLRRIADSFAPASTSTRRKRRLSPWFDSDCRSERRRTRLLERRYRKSMCDGDRTTWVEQMRSMHERKENLYWTICIASEAGNPRTMWNSVSAVLRRCKDPTVQPSCLTADILSKFFKDKIDAVRMETDKADLPTYSSFYGDEFSGFREYSMEEIRGVPIRSPAKTCSLDPIPTDVLLESIDILLPFICLMCNSSLSEACLPESQKAAIITPVLKKSNLDQDDAKNSRPISNLTFISKVIERIVAEQIKKHLVDSNLMPPLQSAYRAGHSTETALIKVISDIIDAADGQQVTFLGLLDMSAAFDTVDHDILLHRLETSYGVRGQALRWLTSFLTGRTQAVSYAGRTFPHCRLACGVPQGSVLGPLLFVLYPSAVTEIAMGRGIRIHVYADDTQIYDSCAASDRQLAATRLLDCVSEIESWMSSNRLKLNTSKTEFIWIGTRQQLSKVDEEVLMRMVCGHSVTPTVKVRDLGVFIDGELAKEAHVSNNVRGCMYQLRQLCSVKRSLTLDSRRALATAFVASRIDYCNGVL